MPSTHHALHYHLVFSTKHQEPMIVKAWRKRLHAYLGGLVKAIDGVPLAVGGVSDHVHLLVSLRPVHQLSEVLRDIKSRSSAWVHNELGVPSFGWQDGYGAFTVSKSIMETVRAYIHGQEEHHRTRSFREEYLALIEKHGIDYDPDYLW